MKEEVKKSKWEESKKIVFRHVTVKEIEKKIDKVNDKPSSSTCGISVCEEANTADDELEYGPSPLHQPHYTNPSKH
jgi:hypothetical protein